MAFNLHPSPSKEHKKSDPDPDPKSALKYVVAVDGSNCAKHAFRWGRFLANPNDRVTIIHSFATELQRKCVEERYTKYTEDGSGKFQLEILHNADDKKPDDPDERITKFVNAGNGPSVDVLVTGIYGTSFEEKQPDFKGTDKGCKSTVGSTSDLSLRRAQCSSFFVRREVDIPRDQHALKICVGVDGSQNSRHAFDFALRVLAPKNTLFVIHIASEHPDDANVPEQYRSENVKANYLRRMEEAQKTLGFEVAMEMKMVEGTVKISDGLCEFAKESGCHILCVGADGMTAHCEGRAILGSVSDECVKDAACNVIVTQINDYCSTPRGSFYRNTK